MESELNGRLSVVASPHPSRKLNTSGKRLEIRALRQNIMGFVAKLILRILWELGSNENNQEKPWRYHHHEYRFTVLSSQDLKFINDYFSIFIYRKSNAERLSLCQICWWNKNEINEFFIATTDFTYATVYWTRKN